MKVIIDRFEGEMAIVEIDEGFFVNLPKVLVAEAKAGDVISIMVDEAATKSRKETVLDLMNQVFED